MIIDQLKAFFFSIFINKKVDEIICAWKELLRSFSSIRPPWQPLELSCDSSVNVGLLKSLSSIVRRRNDKR